SSGEECATWRHLQHGWNVGGELREHPRAHQIRLRSGGNLSVLALSQERQERRVEDVFRLRLWRFELIGKCNLFDRAGKTVAINVAVAIGFHFGRDDVFTDRHVEAL